MTRKEIRELDEIIANHAGSLMGIGTLKDILAVHVAVKLHFVMRDRFGAMFTDAIRGRTAAERVERRKMGICVSCPGPGKPRKAKRGKELCGICFAHLREEINELTRSLNAPAKDPEVEELRQRILTDEVPGID